MSKSLKRVMNKYFIKDVRKIIESYFYNIEGSETKDQYLCIEALMAKYNKKNNKKNIKNNEKKEIEPFLINGQAGTGKTFIISKIIKKLNIKSCALIAPTNKAKKCISR